MIEWDNALGSGTSEVGGRAFMMMVVSTPAISAGAHVWAIAAVVPWVLTMAFEAI